MAMTRPAGWPRCWLNAACRTWKPCCWPSPSTISCCASSGGLSAQTYLLPLPDSDGEDMLAAATWLSLYQAATTGQGGQAEQCLLMRRPEGRFRPCCQVN